MLRNGRQFANVAATPWWILRYSLADGDPGLRDRRAFFRFAKICGTRCLECRQIRDAAECRS
jgi:hypothetical protein